MLPLLDAPLAIVDLETTGADPAADRVTEVALLEVDRFTLRSRWSTLVNPGREQPAPIEALTGISQAMLDEAPRFAAIAAQLRARLEGRLFVAHNAGFDYGFLRREFARAGVAFDAQTLCTVRLSRRLYRTEERHDLDSLIGRHELDCEHRHRALPDAEAVWQFLQRAAAEHGGEVLGVAARQVAHRPALPPQLESALDEVPEAPGVVLLYGEAAPLYIGAGRSMRSRALQRLAAAPAWTPKVRRVEWQRTAGELGALLREAALVRELAPRFNRQRRAAVATAAPAAAWPWRGPLGVVESDRSRDATEVHVIDQWCYLGTASCDAEVAELLEAGAPRFDAEHYRILSRHLGRRGVRTVRLAA